MKNLLTAVLRFEVGEFNLEAFQVKFGVLMKEFTGWDSCMISNSPADKGSEGKLTIRDAIALTIDGEAFAALMNGLDKNPGSLWYARRAAAYRKADAILALKPSDFAQDQQEDQR